MSKKIIIRDNVRFNDEEVNYLVRYVTNLTGKWVSIIMNKKEMVYIRNNCRCSTITEVKREDLKEIMSKNEIKELMDDEVRRLTSQEGSSHITGVRKLVLEEFKNRGIIKDYRWTQNFRIENKSKTNVFYFGSSVGFDSMYLVIL